MERQMADKPNDVDDIEELWTDTGVDDVIAEQHIGSVPNGKPKDYFRTHPDKSYRRRTEIYTHKPEGVIEETHYIIGRALRGRIAEARPCILVTVVDREGVPRLWPVKLAREGEKDMVAWSTARNAVRLGLTKWVKLLWVKGSYQTREALPGYAPDPDFKKLPPFNKLVRMAFGEHGVIRNTNHPVYRELFGMPATEVAPDDTGDDDI
jgi:hypothetical protein